MLEEAEEAGEEPIPAPIDKYCPSVAGGVITIKYREPKLSLALPKKGRRAMKHSPLRRKSSIDFSLSQRNFGASAALKRQ